MSKKKSVSPRPGESTDRTANGSYRTLRNPEIPQYTMCAEIPHLYTWGNNINKMW